jgi:uncharacterized 2Fe-2S/4Fe-4S cluster protein (DUF4445 family)
MSVYQEVKNPTGKFKIKFLPNNVEIDVYKEGENLLKIAMAAGVHINASCGGIGACGKCKVKIIGDNYIGGKSPKLAKEEIEEGYRLACLTKVKGPIEVIIPKESQIDSSVFKLEKDFLLSSSKIKHLLPSFDINPTVYKIFLDVDKPNKDDNINDLDRVLRAIKKQHKYENVSVTFDAVKKLPDVLRKSDFKISATIVAFDEGYKIIDFNTYTENIRNFAFAVDIGTTSISGQLIDLNKCIVKGVDEVDIGGNEYVAGEHSLYNGQVSYGEDVITRIVYAIKGNGLEVLQKAVVKTINDILDEILKKSKVNREEISFMVVAANTTMTQLFLGVNPKYIREAPYVPTARLFPPVKAISLGLNLNDHVYTYTFPNVASYVGGDIVSGVLATGIYQQPELTLFMDIGTNGEIVLGNQDWLVCTSCSAGPAFEGGGIKHGMRATIGAIDHVKINPENLEPMIMTIGDEKPIGICGSGLIEIISELLLTGIINQNGKFNRDIESPRIRQGDEGGHEYVLVWDELTGIDGDIVITEADIDNLMRAKGAIFAGCKTLLDSVGMTFDDIERIIIAGGFGKFINLEKAVKIGLFPELDFNKFIYVGNSSLLGARLVSLSKDLMNEAETISNMMTHIELADNVNFMNEFIAGCFLPHTDNTLFPETIKEIEERRKARLK